MRYPTLKQLLLKDLYSIKDHIYPSIIYRFKHVYPQIQTATENAVSTATMNDYQNHDIKHNPAF